MHLALISFEDITNEELAKKGKPNHMVNMCLCKRTRSLFSYRGILYTHIGLMPKASFKQVRNRRRKGGEEALTACLENSIGTVLVSLSDPFTFSLDYMDPSKDPANPPVATEVCISNTIF